MKSQTCSGAEEERRGVGGGGGGGWRGWALSAESKVCNQGTMLEL